MIHGAEQDAGDNSAERFVFLSYGFIDDSVLVGTRDQRCASALSLGHVSCVSLHSFFVWL
jgi:hypothetical protein